MRIAIVGPTHPYKGGIAQHTTELAHHLQTPEDSVEIISWRRLYPFFYPGVQTVPENKPELDLFPNTQRVLKWNNPLGWHRWAKKLRTYDLVIFVWWRPIIQAPIYVRMLKVLAKSEVKTLLLCHNITGHSSNSIELSLTKKVLKNVNRILVHTTRMESEVQSMTSTPVIHAPMPSHIPGNPDVPRHPKQRQYTLLFFGLVRTYKGVDILIHAMAAVPNVQLIIAGEMWGKQASELRALCARLHIEERIEFLEGYVPADKLQPLFNRADMLILPYRSGTASQMIELAAAYGLPCIATAVGNAEMHIENDINGLLCEPNNVGSLVHAIKKAYQPGKFEKLRDNLPKSHSEEDWQHYIRLIKEIA